MCNEAERLLENYYVAIADGREPRRPDQEARVRDAIQMRLEAATKGTGSPDRPLHFRRSWQEQGQAEE